LNEQDKRVPQQYYGYWDILIVDDEPEVHTVTQLALSDFSFCNRQLRFHNAYNGADAINLLRNTPSISVVLLDVVMETDTAGLTVVKQIREELKNSKLRIILRTGQPEYSPQEHIIREYDINDFKSKTELTRAKLVGSLVTALRSYQQLCELSDYNLGLERIFDAAKAINQLNDLHAFSKEVISQLAILLAGSGKGAMVKLDTNRKTLLTTKKEYTVLAWHRIGALDNDKVFNFFEQTLHTQSHQISLRDCCFFVADEKTTLAIYLETSEPINVKQIKLVEILLQNVLVAFKKVQMLSKLKDAAYRDPLTTLPNRNDFIKKIEHYYSNGCNDFNFYLIDIADFSSINNGLGQDVGDLLLQAVATRIKDALVENCYFARIDADVFAIVVEKEQVTTELINLLLSKPFNAGEHLLTVNFNLGVCAQKYFHKDGKNTLSACYIALNVGKTDSRFNYEYYRPEMEQDIAQKLVILKELHHDFNAHRLEVWFQPQISLVTAEVIGCEALLRWPNTQGGFISPDTFIPLAEQSGLILPIGQWVLEQACQAQNQLSTVAADIRIAINVSVLQFRDPCFTRKVKNTLEHYCVEPKMIELEITESMLMDELEIVIDALAELKEYGLEIAIDDFGTGFSSLSYLNRLPLNRIKIDKTFVKAIEHDSEGIAELIISLSEKFGLKTIAEGVENEKQAQSLKQMGCQEAQGFLYARPMPLAELNAFIAKYSQSAG
jgi:diguanylate cyclase (GGDEF)-like protein